MRAAADELRAELAGERVTFVVNRNINFTNICIVGCAFCGFGQGTPLARRLPRRPRTISRPGCRRRSTTAPPRSACRAASTPTTRSSTTGAGCGWSRRWRRRSTCTPTRRWRSTSCASARDEPPRRSSTTCSSAASGRRREPRRRCSTTASGSGSRRTSCRWRAGWRSSRPATAPGLRSTSTVMFGHIEEPWELARHMRVVRELQERTGGITEFVPLSFIPFNTLLGRTHGVEEISRDENLKHTAAFRLALGQDDHQPPGELGEDGPRRRHREPALGRQRPRRHADGGEHLAHGGLAPRRPARPAAADRRRPRRRAASRRSARPSTRSSRPTERRRSVDAMAGLSGSLRLDRPARCTSAPLVARIATPKAAIGRIRPQDAVAGEDAAVGQHRADRERLRQRGEHEQQADRSSRRRRGEAPPWRWRRTAPSARPAAGAPETTARSLIAVVTSGVVSLGVGTAAPAISVIRVKSGRRRSRSPPAKAIDDTRPVPPSAVLSALRRLPRNQMKKKSAAVSSTIEAWMPSCSSV